MKLSTRSRYGLRAILELARRYGEPAVLMSELAEREELSRKYLHALLTSLRSAGLVRSVRGAGGGFVLTRHPAEIRLKEIVRALEGPLTLVACVENPSRCKRSAGCTARRVWQQLGAAMESMLNSLTLQDLLLMEEKTCAAEVGSSECEPQAKSRTGARAGSAPAAHAAKAARRKTRSPRRM